MNVKILTISILISIFISGCSGTYHAYYQTLKIAFSEQKNAQMTLVDIQQSKADVVSVNRGERSTVIMALAYLENGQHKWVSGDNAMLIVENGRIVRTLGLSKNLLYLSNTHLDPLKSLPYSVIKKDQPQRQTWSRIADHTGDEYGYSIESTFSQSKQDNVQVLGLNTEAVLYIETVQYNAPANYLRLNNSWQNHYWYAKSGELIKSIQSVSPLSEPVEMTYLSRIARLEQ
jgi:hypothetical protein